MILQQIYSGNGVPNFIRIARVLWKILQKKHFGLFSGHIVIILDQKHDDEKLIEIYY